MPHRIYGGRILGFPSGSGVCPAIWLSPWRAPGSRFMLRLPRMVPHEIWDILGRQYATVHSMLSTN